MKLIKIDGYWVIISDEEIQYKDNGKLVVDEYNKIHHLNENSFWRGRLIIASNKPEHHEGWLFPEKAPYNITFSEEVAKELGEVDVEKLAETNTYSKFDRVITGEIEDVKRKMFGRICNYEGFIDGYNQCKEDNKEKKYTEENLMEAFYQGRGKSGGSSHMRTFKYHSFEDYIQSLNKQEYKVEIATKSVCGDNSCLRMKLNGENSSCCGASVKQVPKITNNFITIIKLLK
jgi:hypothetical protein